MPWTPDLFSAAAVARLEEQMGRELRTVPYYAGLLTGETDALIGSFAGEPELHDPIRGRVKGGRAFASYATEVKRWLEQLNVSIQHVDHVVAAHLGVEEDVVELDADSGRIDLPAAIVAEKSKRGIEEMRIYHTTWRLTGRHVHRPPLLQPDPELRGPDIVGDYQRALADGDAGAIVDMFEPGGYVREPAGGDYVHPGPDHIRGFYEWLFSNGGGIPLEHCTIIDDERACAVEYNVVQWGQTELPPQAGIAVYVRGESGKLSAARIYDDADPPLEAPD